MCQGGENALAELLRASNKTHRAVTTIELYRLGGYPVNLPHVMLGLAITVLLTWLNYQGIQASAKLGKGTTFTFLTLLVIFALAGAQR